MTNRVALGAIGGGNFGLKVSTPGNDVLTGTMEDDKLSFDSSWSSTLKLKASGITTLTPAGSGFYTQNIYYGITFPVLPLLLVYENELGRLGFFGAMYGGNGGSEPNNAYAETSKVYTDRFSFRRSSAASYTLYWYAFLI